jgi:hypothetical protein
MVLSRWGAAGTPIYRLFEQESVFTPEEISAISDAFEAALHDLGLVNRSDPLVETVAAKIIELAKAGERDRERLLAQVLAIFDQSARKAC